MHITEQSPFTPVLPFSFHSTAFDASQYQDTDFAFFNQPLPSKLQRAVAKRKAEYLAGRVCAANAMASLGITNFELRNGENRAPIWPEKIRGAITHSKGIAMAMVTDAEHVLGIGIDIEHYMADKQELELQGQILREDESEVFAQLGQRHDRPLTLVFSAKESIYKALYGQVQNFFGFDAARLVSCSDNTLCFALTSSLHETLPQGFEITVYYQCANNMVLTECVHIKQ
ncbi:4'-phosphopantetheinyl transferase superfamily protein [Pseudoalteromonas luteoviolacea]|uniref:4'-phosphopantetheinyl transferase family protein n=1 Tax=Pseudoalteromonas luteoviolacea TaxID=43657 RepID=UPI001B35A87F|nr:4'-phosphopantetheinyl transferase superfamily protein [Pseudoalteromonas luteoviolacea]MBQ4813179.1 4'-phosphopantetheinyl transferase superfamily protein [Pseudoalteromonas luteoviolacea]